MSADSGQASGGRSHRGRRLALFAAAPLFAAGALFGISSGGTGSGGSGGTEPRNQPATTPIVRRTLVEREAVEGTLGYGAATSVTNRGQGTVTRLAAEGSVVERNGALYALDGREVRLFYGDVPAYRRMAADSTPGADITQLEANLKELGFAKGLISKPDTKWDEGTTAAVKRWQKAAGADQDGVVEDGEIVFLPGAARIASHEAAVGSAAQPGGAVLKVTGTTRQVSVDLDARKQRLAQQGAKADVELPDGNKVAGTITGIASVAKKSGDDSGGQGAGGDDSKTTVAVTLTLDDAKAGGSLDGAPVKVRLVRTTREGVLAVPVHALVALAEGGYGLEVSDGATRRYVKVETGLFAEGMVEVSGDGVSEGMHVVVPA